MLVSRKATELAEFRTIEVTLKDDAKGEKLGSISLHTFTLSDAFVLKNETGMTFNEMVAGLDKRDPHSTRALVWFLKFKRGDGDHISTIDFPMANFSFVVVENPTKARTGKRATATSESSPITAV